MSVRKTDITNSVEYLNATGPFQSNLLIATEDPDELGAREEKATKANVEVVISPSAVINNPSLVLVIFSKNIFDSFWREKKIKNEETTEIRMKTYNIWEK